MRIGQHRSLLAVILAATCCQAASSAPTVEYRIQSDEASGTFQIYASASPDDNAGIALYGIVLNGPISLLDHVTPYSNSALGANNEYGAAGFSLFRSAANATRVHAAQDTIDPSSHLIYGLGQTAGSFSERTLTVKSSARGDSWGGDLLIASGTYDPQLGSVGIDYGSVDTLAYVFSAAGGATTLPARIIPDPSYVPSLPEPSPPPRPDPQPSPAPVIPPPPLPAPQLPPASDPTSEATVRYRIDATETGEFKLYASTNTQGHAGIALYAVALTGGVTSVDHVSPATMSAENASLQEGSAGFTLFRSKDGEAWVYAAQDNITATPHILYGIGQESGSFTELGLTPATSVEGAEWGADVLLATGTFDATLGSIGIDYENTLANVFNSTSNTSTRAATIIQDPTLIAAVPPIELPPPPLPEGPAPPIELPDVVTPGLPSSPVDPIVSFPDPADPGILLPPGSEFPAIDPPADPEGAPQQGSNPNGSDPPSAGEAEQGPTDPIVWEPPAPWNEHPFINVIRWPGDIDTTLPIDWPPLNRAEWFLHHYGMTDFLTLDGTVGDGVVLHSLSLGDFDGAGRMFMDAGQPLSSNSSDAAVPEPSAGVIAFGALLATLIARRNRQTLC